MTLHQASRELRLLRVSGRVTQRSRVTLFANDVRLGTQVIGAGQHFFFHRVPARPGRTEIKAYARSLTDPALRAWGITTYDFEPDQPTIPSFSMVPKITRDPYLSLRGTADPGDEILLAGIDKVYHVTRARSDGSFALNVLLPEPGKYVLRLRARDANEVLSPFSAPVKIEYNPKLPSAGPRAKATLGFAISHKTLDSGVWVELPKDDYRALDLIAGQSTTDDFLEEIFGSYTLEGSDVFSSYFRDARPSIKISDEKVAIEIRARRRNLDRLPVTAGDIEIQRFASGSGESHVLLVKIQDYSARSLNPPPRKWEGGLAEWSMDSRVSKNVRIRLEYDPFKTRNSFLRLLRLSPYSLLSYPRWILVSALYAFLRALPILWLLDLLERWSRSRKDSLVSCITSLGRWLLALSFVELMLLAADGIAYTVYDKQLAGWLPLQEFRGSDQPVLKLAGILILTLASAVLVFLFRWPLFGKRLLRPLQELARALWIAALLGFAMLSSAAALSAFSWRIPEPRLPSLVLAAPFSILLVLWLMTLGRLVFGHRVSLSRKERILAALAGLALSFPVTLSPSSGIWEITLSNARGFFSAFGAWLPYAVLLCILLLLRRASRAGQHREVREVRLAALLFAGFLVGASSNVFLVPLPFLIAVLIFPLFVLAPRERRHALDASRSYVLEHRESLLRAVLEAADARRFREALIKLRKKVIHGEMTPRDFEKHRAEMEIFIGEPRFRRPPRALEASEAVLSVGPCSTDWENGLWSLRRGAILALPLALLYIVVFLIQALWLQNPFRGLAIGMQLIGAIADWLLGAFFLGYFFSSIQGASGLRKGLRLSLAIVACFLPVWLMGIASPNDLRALVLRAAQIILFYTVLGVWAFDYRIFRQLPRKDFGWRELVDLEEVPSLTAFASIVLAGAGVVINSILSEPATGVLPLLAKWFFSGAGGAGPTPLP